MATNSTDERYLLPEEAITRTIVETLPPSPDAPRVLLVVLAAMLGDFLALVPLDARLELLAEIQRIMLMSAEDDEPKLTVQ